MAAPRTLARQLTRWYRQHARELPWRQHASDPVTGPYRVWVSEVMLQQTQVATVLPYYQRWMRSYPTVERLAEAPLEEVLGHWSGLGYYARCRNLHRAARSVVADHDGRVPEDAAALDALPGIGRYTSGALRSIAFGQKVPLVDGNVARVLCRLDGLGGDPQSASLQRRLWARATELVEACEHPGDFNQSLMELGATVCTPAAPACDLCPVRVGCEARRTGRQEALPRPRRRAARKTESGIALVVRSRGAVLLARRHETLLLGGLWEPPRVGPADIEGARSAGAITHVFTHRELTLHVFERRVSRRRDAPVPDPAVYSETRWVPFSRPGAVPLSKLAHKVLGAAGLGGEGGGL